MRSEQNNRFQRVTLHKPRTGFQCWSMSMTPFGGATNREALQTEAREQSGLDPDTHAVVLHGSEGVSVCAVYIGGKEVDRTGQIQELIKAERDAFYAYLVARGALGQFRDLMGWA